MSLWLHGQEDFISEAGAMNMFMIKMASDGFLEFVTMPLANGIVLPGITRASIISLIEDHAASTGTLPLEGMPRNIRVVERDYSMPEVVQGLQDGSVQG
jgi:branched-chain amino acid aminotransferase